MRAFTVGCLVIKTASIYLGLHNMLYQNESMCFKKVKKKQCFNDANVEANHQTRTQVN